MTPSLAQRETECPACGARQSESAAIVGTICRSCGESYSVPPLPEPNRSKALRLWVASVAGMTRQGWTAVKSQCRRPPATGRLRHGRLLPTPFQIVDDPPCPIQAFPAGHRRVACPFCQAPANLPARAISHACSECGQHFPTRDYTIDSEIHANLATAGTVLIHHRGCLIASSLRCGELIVYGQTEGALTVTGLAEYHGPGDTIGELHCGHLVMARDARRTFHQRIFAIAADIHGDVTGDLCCAGRLHISRGAAVHGDVLAGQIQLDAGGQINGSMGTLTAVLSPNARLTETARALRHNFGQVAR
ncbi:MAG: polymer-forming cytoskeletal protein [Verrucomicrobiales bacterium]